MSDWFTTSLHWQKRMLDAQRASLSAGQQMVSAGDALVRMQETGRQALEANMAAWHAWASLWGGGR